MRLILKLFVAPIALVLTILSALLAFIHSMSRVIFSVASGLVFIGAVILLFTGEITGGIAFMAVAFLVSPYGLYALAGWLVDVLGSAGDALQGFIAR
jgi:hypothetical protein